MWSMCSAVFLPGRIPGMYAPERLMFSATSAGLIMIAV
jgi:hypothetical protein